MLQFSALKFSYHQIGIRLKIVNHEKFEAVPQLTRGQKHYESVIDYQESMSTQTEYIYCACATVLKFGTQ